MVLLGPSWSGSAGGDTVPRPAGLSTSRRLSVPMSDQRASEMQHALYVLECCTKCFAKGPGRGHILEEIVHNGLDLLRRIPETVLAGYFVGHGQQIGSGCQRARRWGQRSFPSASGEAQCECQPPHAADWTRHRGHHPVTSCLCLRKQI